MPLRELTEADIQPQLTRRRPGQSRLTTPRAEKDLVTIMSGTEFGRTLGTPIGLFVPNEDQRPGDYKEMNAIPRPGHADFTFQVKYGTRASSGGGRSSARETIGRVAAGAIAEKWMNETYGTEISCWVSSIGDVSMPDSAASLCAGGRGWSREEVDRLGCLRMLRCPRYWHEVTEAEVADTDARKKAQMAIEIKAEEEFLAELSAAKAGGQAAETLKALPAYEDHAGRVYNSAGEALKVPSDLEKWRTDELLPLRCPHPPTCCRMATLIRQVKSEKDSIGGTVACVLHNVPPALGEPVFDRFEAMLAHAMLSLPATKGFEFGSGARRVALPSTPLPSPPRVPLLPLRSACATSPCVCVCVCLLLLLRCRCCRCVLMPTPPCTRPPARTLTLTPPLPASPARPMPHHDDQPQALVAPCSAGQSTTTPL